VKQDLDEIFADTWIRRDANLNGLSYQEYLDSDHWREVKLKAAQRPNYQKCEFCESTVVELHHTSYKWILTKNELRVIISLCRIHHQEIHNLAKHTQISIRSATNILRKRYKLDYRQKNRI